MTRRSFVLRLVTSTSLAALLVLGAHVGASSDTLPAALTDAEFWSLTEQFSEPNGYFLSDNLVSNEMALSTVAALLAARTQPGGVYLGVGPEQNFTYIAALKPKMAFINDIRRGNWHMHMMYKALFELSADRAEFFSRLFVKTRPPGLTASSTAADIMNGFWDLPTGDEAAFEAGFKAVKDALTATHKFPLSQEDLDGIRRVLYTFYWYGPRITYSATATPSNVVPRGTTYADLMMALDAASKREGSYLSSEEGFRFLKTLESKNLLVPSVGDFAGPKALRAIGQYIRDHGATVTAFYVSNVEQYLSRNGVWGTFCGNVATMPLDPSSVFIRPGGAGSAVSVTFRTTVDFSGNRTVTTVNGQPLTLMSTGQPAAVSGRLGSPFGAIKDETADCTAR
jgi:hypothetical protein